MSDFAADLTARIYVAGHRGLVGSALVRALKARGYDNLMIQANVIQAAYRQAAKKLLFLGSSCIYPKHAPQPMKEGYLLTGPLEPTNEPYAVAKIAGIKLCQAYNRQYGTRFISVMPTNLYGPNDNFDLETAHVLPALIRKFHTAKEEGRLGVTVWGTAASRREFLHVDDLADACLFLMACYEENEPINIGTGEDLPIAELAAPHQPRRGYPGLPKRPVAAELGAGPECQKIWNVSKGSCQRGVRAYQGERLIWRALSPWPRCCKLGLKGEVDHMITSLREKISQEIEDLSEDQQEKLLQWIQIMQKMQIKPPTGELGLKRPFKREEFYEDALPHRL